MAVHCRSDLYSPQINGSHNHFYGVVIDDKTVVNACMKGNLSVIQEYLESGHNVNDFLITGWTLLLTAASYAQLHIIKYLLNVGADVNLDQDGYTPLMALSCTIRGSSTKRLLCLKHLIERKANVNASNKVKETALMYACKMQEINFILELLKHVADINFADAEQRTALFFAVTSNRYDVTKILIEQGADITWINYRGLSAFDVAIAKGYNKLTPLLKIDQNEDEQDYVEINTVSSWSDMFPTVNEANLNSVDSDVESILYGMGLESYKTCFRGIDLKTFLRLKEEDLERLGIDISVHRKKFIDELLRFHKHEWSNNLMKIDKSKPFTPFEGIQILGNINKQLCVISSSIYFSKNYLNSIQEAEDLNFNNDDIEKIKNELKNIQLITLKIEDATSRVHSLAETLNEENSYMSLPMHIEKRKKNNKWIIIAVITFISISLFKMKSIKRLWYEKVTTKSWRNMFNFSLFDMIYNKFYNLNFLVQKS